MVDGQGKVTEPSLESELKKEFNKGTLDEEWLDKTSVEGKWRITIDGVYLDVPAGIDVAESQVDEDTISLNINGTVEDTLQIDLSNCTTQDEIMHSIVDAFENRVNSFYGNWVFYSDFNQSVRVFSEFGKNGDLTWEYSELSCPKNLYITYD